MPKRELHRVHVQAPRRDREPQGRKLVFRLGRKTKASGLEKNGKQAVKVLPPPPPERNEEPTLSTASALVPLQKRLYPRQDWQLWLLWLSVFSFVGVTVTAGVLWLTQLPPPVQCQSISPLSTDSERLYCAQRTAESGNIESLEAAMKLVQHWSSDHPLYSEAQRLMKQWSQAVLQIAEQNIKQGNRSGALAIASKIPASSPLYPEVQAQIAAWKQELNKIQKITSQFQEALKEQKWSNATQFITELAQINQDRSDVWRIDTLIKQLASEKEAWQLLEEARELAKTNQLAQLEEALALVGKVNPKSYVRAEAMREQSQWSRSLLQVTAGLFKNQDFDGVIKVAQKIPDNTAQYAEAQDWVQIGRAAQSAKKDNILTLLDALAAVRRIEPKSTLYSVATKQTTLWQTQLQDHIQLQLAGAIASFKQQAGLQMAIEQAMRVEPGRPKRLSAQTLIAQWRKEIQHIEDQNNLRYAEQLGARGTLEQLKAAVEVASRIQLGQPLRIEAQTMIATWNRKIQTAEDQPILDLAKTFAQREDWIAAIATAEQIRPGRALSSEAQQAIGSWQAQVQIAQDRPIIEAATALAAQGRFDAAIATISQISAYRALYGEAQALKDTWISQKEVLNGAAPSVTLEHE